MTNSMGCSFLLMAAVALMVGFIPILNWITLFVALPMAAAAVISAGLTARKPTAQSADTASFWFAIGLTAAIIFRLTAL